MDETPQDLYLTVGEVAERTGLTEEQVWRRLENGTFSAIYPADSWQKVSGGKVERGFDYQLMPPNVVTRVLGWTDEADFLEWHHGFGMLKSRAYKPSPRHIRVLAETVLSEERATLSAPPAPAPASEPTETAPARRARLLAWHEEEESVRGKRGALERVTARERECRQTAERGNIGKDIKKAREERADKRRAGALLGPLGKQ